MWHPPAVRLTTSILALTCALFGCTSSQVWFSAETDVAVAVVIPEIGAATEDVRVAMYTFTDTSISDALIEAKDGRGLVVQVVLDSTQEANDVVARSLAAAEVDLRCAQGYDAGGIMHHKYTLLDGRHVLTGSYNYTLSADERNDEHILLLTDAELALSFAAAFDDLWARATPCPWGQR